MRFDLHIHSCLSGCAALEMSPRAIVRRARREGLSALAITDHNSARNLPALAEVCAAEGVSMLAGIEVTTLEEAHVLCFFDVLDDAVSLGEAIFSALPRLRNRPLLFGDQAVVNARDEVLELEPRFLRGAASLSLSELAVRVRERQGLLVAAHVDRLQFSVIHQLGFLPGNIPWDAVEVSAFCSDAEARKIASGRPWIRSSDAHQLDQIGASWCDCELPEFSVDSLRRALNAGRVSCARRRS